MKMNQVVELLNIEHFNCCKLNTVTGEKEFCKGAEKADGFTGFYYMDSENFFAIYPTSYGPMMYYEGKEYPLKKDLHIHLTKMGDWRRFFIEEYHIKIDYPTSQYIGFDVWSDEEDVDLFCQIEQSYQDKKYYEKFTK